MFLFFRGTGFAKDVIIFGVDMSSSTHIDNKRKNIAILDKDQRNGLVGTTFTAEKKYSINVTNQQVEVCIIMFCIIFEVLHYNGVMKYINSNQKILKLMALYYV